MKTTFNLVNSRCCATKSCFVDRPCGNKSKYTVEVDVIDKDIPNGHLGLCGTHKNLVYNWGGLEINMNGKVRYVKRKL